MSILIKAHRHYIFLLTDPTISKAQFRALLSTASNGQVNAITEITLNLLRGTIPTTPEVKAKLLRQAKCLRKLASAKTSIRARRECLQPKVVQTILHLSLPILKKALEE